jgi:Fe-S-cluster containining protein
LRAGEAEVADDHQEGGGPRAGALAAPAALVPGRSCGSCSLCCKVIAVAELQKPAGQWCIHSARERGCNIHDVRPPSCRAFFCAWLIDPNLGPEWKPEISRFVLTQEPKSQALVVMADPGMPLAWKREPYYSALRRLSESLFRLDRKVLVNQKGQISVVLPDRDVPLGVVAPEEIAVWREGSTYGAMLRRELAAHARRESAPVTLRPQPAEGKPQQGACAPLRSLDDPGFLQSVFREAFEKTSRLLDDPHIDDPAALASIIGRRNKALDETAQAYGRAGRAQCRAGCISCCHLMVMGPPSEILAIARHLLDTRTSAEIEAIKQRLGKVAEIPLDPALRVKSRIPCGLLENGRCVAYEQRPAVCRMTLSQSRAACDACLEGTGTAIPYIEQPSRIAAVMQAGIDYALLTRRNLSTEGAELARALLVALADYQGTLTNWLDGKDPFPGAHRAVPGAPTSSERAAAAVRRFGLPESLDQSRLARSRPGR